MMVYILILDSFYVKEIKTFILHYLFLSLSLYIQHNLVQTDTDYNSYNLRVI